MPRRAKVKYLSLRSCLVNLPISVYGPLVEHQVRPQSLAIHLAKAGRTTNKDDGKPSAGYFGWTGMAASSSLAAWDTSNTAAGEAQLETVELDPQYAQTFGFSEGDIVEIGLLHKMPVAKAVHTEPLTADDWEILELHAEYVENNLLSQVRVVAVDQEIDVWVLGRTRIRFRVVSYDPPGQAVLLTTDTEVVIAPKSRSNASKKTSGSKKPKITEVPPISIPAQEATATNSANLTLRVLPSEVLRLPHASATETPPRTILYVSPSTFQELAHEYSGHFDVRVRRLKPPASRVGDNGDGAKSAGGQDSATPAPKVLQGTKAPSSPIVTAPCALRAFSLVPDRHCVIVRGSTGDVDGSDNWDIISVSLVATSGHPEEPPSPSILTPGEPFSPPDSPKHNLAGVDAILSQANAFVINALAVQRIQGSHPNLLPGLLVYGAPGSGRTSVAKTIAKELEQDSRAYTYTLYVDLAKHSEDRVPTLREGFQSWLELAAWHSPSLIILDNIDRVVGPEVEHADSFRSKHIAESYISVFCPKTPPSGVVVLATCQGQAAVHPILSSAHIFSIRLSLKPPGKEARKEILSRIVAERSSTSNILQDPAQPLNFTALATVTDGYSATDLRDLVGRAIHEAALRCSKGGKGQPNLTAEDFVTAQIDFTPLSLRDVKLQKSEVSWSDIGGLQDTRRILRETLEWPTKYGAIFAKCPLRLRSGLLLYGYPGCGKTLLASAVAKECGLNFISVKGPELLNKYIGASEKSVRDIFDRASAAKPCVLFFDEFDSIAPKRGHDSTGVTDRVVNQMLTQMDGAEGLDGVYVLAATSRPDLIDPALLRPGRLDKSLLCGMPDEKERLEILQALSRKVPISEDVDLGPVARDTEGYSGADLQAIMYNAHLEVVHQSIAEREEESGSSDRQGQGENSVQFTMFGGAAGRGIASKAEEGALMRRLEVMLAGQVKGPTIAAQASVSKQHAVKDEHLQHSVASTRPSVSPEERYRLEQTYKAFVSERSGKLPVPPEDMTIGSRQSLG